jgi:hypothetical protein
VSPVLTLFADALVAVLLVATIVSSFALSRRIARLKADEAALRQTISDLMLATESAERAIGGLRATLGECDRTLADRLRTAERYAADLAVQVEAGEGVMARIAKIVESSRRTAPTPEEPPPAPPTPALGPNGERLGAAAAAAQALAERALRRLGDRAA